jgi:acetyltransferase-like isoleucine patch superfamily enzyme
MRAKIGTAFKLSLSKTLYYSIRFHGPIIVFRGTCIRLSRGARIELAPGARLYLGFNPLVTPASLTIKRDGRLSIHSEGKVEISSGSRLIVAENAHLEIGGYTFIHHNAVISCWEHVTIGSECGISWDVHIMDGNGHELIVEDKPRPTTRPTHIGDRVWIGSRVSIVGASIGDGCMVGAGSVVSSAVPPKSLAAGNPARVIHHDISFKPHHDD